MTSHSGTEQAVLADHPVGVSVFAPPTLQPAAFSIVVKYAAVVQNLPEEKSGISLSGLNKEFEFNVVNRAPLADEDISNDFANELPQESDAIQLHNRRFTSIVQMAKRVPYSGSSAGETAEDRGQILNKGKWTCRIGNCRYEVTSPGFPGIKCSRIISRSIRFNWRRQWKPSGWKLDRRRCIMYTKIDNMTAQLVKSRLSMENL
ncbi:hypothetical protein RUND412_001455 [Rhizina undulata]